MAAGGLEAVNEDGAVLTLGGGDDRGGTVTASSTALRALATAGRVVSRCARRATASAATVVGLVHYTFARLAGALFPASTSRKPFDQGEADGAPEVSVVIPT